MGCSRPDTNTRAILRHVAAQPSGTADAVKRRAADREFAHSPANRSATDRGAPVFRSAAFCALPRRVFSRTPFVPAGTALAVGVRDQRDACHQACVAPRAGGSETRLAEKAGQLAPERGRNQANRSSDQQDQERRAEAPQQAGICARRGRDGRSGRLLRLEYGGDYVLDHEVVVGRVEGARYLSHTRSPGAYQLLIDHRAYDIPATSPRKWDVGITSKSMLASHRGRSWRSGATFIRPGATCHSRRTMGRVRFAGNFTEGEECPFCHTRLERAS